MRSAARVSHFITDSLNVIVMRTSVSRWSGRQWRRFQIGRHEIAHAGEDDHWEIPIKNGHDVSFRGGGIALSGSLARNRCLENKSEKIAFLW